MENSGLEKFAAIAGLILSMVFFLTHIIFFCKGPSPRNLPGCNLASLCLSLFLSSLFLLMLEIPHVAHNRIACTAATALAMFFFHGSIVWRYFISVDIFRSVRMATECFSKPLNLKKHFCNSVICWVVSSVLVNEALTKDSGVEFFDSNSGNSSDCWVISRSSFETFFGLPMYTIFGFNIVVFGATAYTMCKHKTSHENYSKQTSPQKKLSTYLRLAFVMDITWTIGILVFSLRILPGLYVFSIFSFFQGLAVFLANTCNSEVKNFLKKKTLPKNAVYYIPMP